MEAAYIGLGSNQGDSEKILEKSLEMCAAIPQTAVIVTSKSYLTEPWGDPAQPWFHNRVARLETALEPRRLLAELHLIENSLGRVRNGRRYGPRTLDLDLLLYGNSVIESDELTVPHPRMHLRAFVLAPLHEIAPKLVMPDGQSLETLMAALNYVIKGDKIYQKD